MRIAMVVRKHPVLSYFALAVTWSYLYWQLLFTIFPIDLARGPTLMHVLLAGVGGSPSLFGLLVIYWAQGKVRLRVLLARLSLWRVGIGWYAAALLLFPGLNALTYILNRGLGGEVYAVNLGALGFGIAAGIIASILEEFGWRGFALPALQRRYSALTSSLIIGLGWGLWHLRLNVTQLAQYGSLAIPLLLLSAPVNLTASAVLMTWIHNNARGSMLLMLLAHLSVTSSSLLFSPPAAAPGDVLLRWQLLWAGVQWAAVAVVLVREGAQRLTRGDLPPLAR